MILNMPRDVPAAPMTLRPGGHKTSLFCSVEKLVYKERYGKSHSNAMRRMLSQFIIQDIYKAWRVIEKLPIAPSYAEQKLGLKHYEVK